MVHFAQSLFPSKQSQCKGSVIFLSALWSLGLLLGLYFASSNGDEFSRYILGTALKRQTFAGAMTVVLVPVIITALAIHFSKPAFIFGYSVLKAFSFSGTLCGVMFAFGQSGWLIRLFLLFTDSICVLLMLWLWNRFFYLDTRVIRRNFWSCAIALLVIGFVDYFAVSPYFTSLLNYS